jgi:RsiW-degrading membrane proteinase PrsW (M82 family)
LDDTQLIILSAIGGILPAFLWLWFWLREDSANPEPKRLIMLTFIFGMVTVVAVLPIEKFIKDRILVSEILMIVILSFVEELGKLISVWLSSLRKKECDEPIDPMIYMITGALGFAALENALFLFGHNSGGILSLLATSNLRFVGASLLHVLASGIIGFFIGISLYKKNLFRISNLLLGLSIATILHAFFNLFIITMRDSGLVIAFLYVWMLIILLLAAFEKVKKLKVQN